MTKQITDNPDPVTIPTPAPAPMGVCTVIPGAGMILQPFSFEVVSSHVKDGFLLLLDSEGHQHVFPSGYNGRIVISQEPKEVVH